MEFIRFEKVRDGKYLKNYEITYLNKAGREKKYEIVSRRDLSGIEDVGGGASGVSIVALCQGKLLLLHEFRMGVNKYVYNLCAGMIEPGESIEECIRRELFEARFYSREEVKYLLETEPFSSRAQMAAYFFAEYGL